MVAKPLSSQGQGGAASFREVARSVIAGRDLAGVLTRALMVAAVAPVAVLGLATGLGPLRLAMAIILAVAIGAGCARFIAAFAIAEVQLAVRAAGQIAATGEAGKLPRSWLAEADGASMAVNGIVARFGETTRRLQRQALHDSLTGLPNRELFMSRLTRALADRRHGVGPLAVMFLDVDDFKALNDTMGHGAGDAFLIAFSQRVRSAVQGRHTVARLGGDEFAVIVETGAAEAEARQVADRVHQALRRPFSVSDRQIVVTTSVGVAVSQYRDVSATELLRVADIGLYQAKGRGKDRCVVLQTDARKQRVQVAS